MDTRIQFRVDEETKRLAQQMAENQGRTLSDACLELTDQVNLAFEKLDSGKAVFVEHAPAKSRMAERKAKIRNRGKL